MLATSIIFAKQKNKKNRVETIYVGFFQKHFDT
jgi:hypothetical protein